MLHKSSFKAARQLYLKAMKCFSYCLQLMQVKWILEAEQSDTGRQKATQMIKFQMVFLTF
jgi:hypothetical protein